MKYNKYLLVVEEKRLNGVNCFNDQLQGEAEREVVPPKVGRLGTCSCG